MKSRPALASAGLAVMYVAGIVGGYLASRHPFVGGELARIAVLVPTVVACTAAGAVTVTAVVLSRAREHLDHRKRTHVPEIIGALGGILLFVFALVIIRP